MLSRQRVRTPLDRYVHYLQRYCTAWIHQSMMCLCLGSYKTTRTNHRDAEGCRSSPNQKKTTIHASILSIFFVFSNSCTMVQQVIHHARESRGVKISLNHGCYNCRLLHRIEYTVKEAIRRTIDSSVCHFQGPRCALVKEIPQC